MSVYVHLSTHYKNVQNKPKEVSHNKELMPWQRIIEINKIEKMRELEQLNQKKTEKYLQRYSKKP